MKKYFHFTIIAFLFFGGCSASQNNEINNLPVEEVRQVKNIDKLINEKFNKQKNNDHVIQTSVETEQNFPETKSLAKPQIDFVRGIYLTAYKVASSEFEQILNMADSAGINTVVFDLKNMNGEVFFRTRQNSPLAADNVRPIINIGKVVESLHKRNMKAVSRVVIFHDQYNAQRDSLLRPQTYDGSAWRESKKISPSWLDPSNSQVQSYLLTLIEEIAQNGVDEIQMDYIRFPTQGRIDQAIFDFQQEDSLFIARDSTYVRRDKSDIITDFITRAKKICSKYDVSLTADVFAIVAWQRKADIQATGQNIKRIAKHLDAVHPMIYSSHFAADFGYRENVYNEAYHLVYKGTKLIMDNTYDDCKVIPYIQSFTWKVNYQKEYIIAQIKAIEHLGADGYILWNSSNKYQRTLTWIKEHFQAE